MTIVWIVCQERLSTLRSDARVEGRSGIEYQALSGQPVDELICELPQLTGLLSTS